MASLNELFILLIFLLSHSPPPPLLVISLLAGFRPIFFNFQVVALAAVGKYFALQPRPGFHVFEIRSGHPLISRLVFCFSLLLLFFFFLISLIGNISSVLFLLWLFIVSHIYFLPSPFPGISVLQGILKFPVGLLALGNAIP